LSDHLENLIIGLVRVVESWSIDEENLCISQIAQSATFSLRRQLKSVDGAGERG